MPDEREQARIGLAGRRGAAPRPRRALQPGRPLRERAARGLRRRLGEPGRARALQDRRAPGDGQEHHRHQRQPRHQLRPVDQSLSRLRARLHLLLRAADPLLPRPFRRASISRPSSTPRSTPPSCWSASWPIRAMCRSTSRSAPSPTPTSRSSASTASPASMLEVLDRTSHPVGIVTKSALVVRDIDILARMASRGLVKVAISVTTLDRRIARKMEPRAATPPQRLEAIKALSRGRRAGRGHGGPHHPGHQRQRDRAHPGRGPRCRRHARPATCCCACRWS